jgi:heme-degrading monooxygenase HmoA
VIARIWHGWARPPEADAYERYFRETLTPELLRIPGFAGAHLLRRQDGGEVELSTVTWFESLEAVRRFAGDGYERAVVSEHARALLTRYDTSCRHYEVAGTAGGAAP